MAQTTNDNSGMGVVLGILIAVLIVIGGFFFLKSQGVVEDGGTTTATVEAPDVNINAAEPAAGDVAPSPSPAQ